MKLRLSALALGTTLLVGCASSGTDQQGRSDPLEGFNRTMYNFNRSEERRVGKECSG